MKIDVYAECEGKRELVGAIETLQGAGERFSYAPEWLAGKNKPVSYSLPLQVEPFSAKQMRPYFDGLLPEGAAREALAKSVHVSPRSYVKLLAALGDECIGAVSFYAVGDEPEEGYAPFSESQLEALAKKSYQGTTAINKHARMSLAGAQAKVGLYRAEDGSWYQPLGGAPSTHILKPLNTRFEDVQINEALCLLTAKTCGLPVPEIEVLPTKTPLFCTRRYDRAFPNNAALVDGLPRPMRLHQEDCCQALGIVPEHKYEESNQRYLKKVAELIRAWSSEPLEDLRNLWALAVFNYLIGNCDAHLKNIAFVRDKQWKTVRLAPFYDLVCTTYYDGLVGSLAMSFGGRRKLETIDRACLEGEAEALHLATHEAERLLDTLVDAVPDAVMEIAKKLAAYGYGSALPMADQIAGASSQRADAVK